MGDRVRGWDPCRPARRTAPRRIAAELARTGLALPGTLIQRRMRCGWASCGCHADPPQLHGPYWQWTRKMAAKTICRWSPTTSSTTTGNGWTTTAACANWSPSWKTSPSPSPTSAAATRPAPAEPGKHSS